MDNNHLKKIQYLLEDFSRLTEVSKKELTEWEEKMPFYQPLKLLLAKKNEMLGMHDTHAISAAFYSNDIDFDPYEKERKTYQIKENIINPPVTVNGIVEETEEELHEVNETVEATTSIEAKTSNDEKEDETTLESFIEIQNEQSEEETSLPILNHELASDEMEESILSELEDHKDDSTTSEHAPADNNNEIDDADTTVEVIDSTEEGDHEISIEPKEKPQEEKVKKETRTSILNHDLASDELEDTLPDELLEKIDFTMIGGYMELIESELNEVKLNEKDREKISQGILSNLKVEVVESSTNLKIDITDQEDQSIDTTEQLPTESVEEKPSDPRETILPKSKKKKKKKKKKKEKEFSRPTEISDDEEFSFTDWLNKTKSIDPDKKPKRKKKKEKKKVKGKKKSKKFKERKVITEANKSLQLDNNIISETLADILASQGHNSEAKEMYTQLSLLFPEKSSYFADKIKNL